MRSTLLILALVLGACGGGDNTIAPTDPPSVERLIPPADTDAQITTDPENHFVINPSPEVDAKGRLFVFLPGSGMTPAVYRSIVRTGARRGYHALGLNYPNGVTVATLCTMNEDPDCHAKVRREVITGEDASPLGTVTPANSIVNRLQKLIAYLHANHADEGWGQYLDGDGQIIWSRINLAGHSQGGGHAGMMAKLYALNRVAYFSAPSDFRYPEEVPAGWVALPNTTDASRQYGFAHLQDTASIVDRVVWDELGLDIYGGVTSVDDLGAPFGNTHQLVSNATPNPGVLSSAHNATVVDTATPRTPAGALAYEPVWIYLCFP